MNYPEQEPTRDRSHVVGDKGKKDKDKSDRQKLIKQDHADKVKQDKQPKRPA